MRFNPVFTSQPKPSNDAVPASYVYVCSDCGKEVKRVEAATEERLKDFKCFSCVSRSASDKNGGGGGTGFPRRLGIDPPRRNEAEGDDVVVAGFGGDRRRHGVRGGDTTSTTDIKDIVSPNVSTSPGGPSPVDHKGKRIKVVSPQVPSKKPRLQPSGAPTVSQACSPVNILGNMKKGEMALSFPASGPTQQANESVEHATSNLTVDAVEHLFVTANISSTDFDFLIPTKDQRANKPPEGYISVYAEQVKVGLRFPLHNLVIEICKLINVSPSQLVPRAHHMMVGFILCAKLYKIPPTAACFFSLFSVTLAPQLGFFQFVSRKGKNFLRSKRSSQGPWNMKFFFIRPKDPVKSWNCLSRWKEAFLKPPSDATLLDLAIKSGILNHHFWINKLIDKKILVHGGIQPGVPSLAFPYRYLMQRAAVTKFKLLPEDRPRVRKTAGNTTNASASPVSISSSNVSFTVAPPFAVTAPASSPSRSRGPLSSATAMTTHTVDPSISADPGLAPATPATIPATRKALISNFARSNANDLHVTKSSPTGLPEELPSRAEVPMVEDFSASSEDGISLKKLFQEHEDRSTESFEANLFREWEEDRAMKSFEVPVVTNTTAPVADEAHPQPPPSHLLAISQILESAFVPKECFQKLEMDAKELASELAFSKYRVQELEQELELSEAKRIDSENNAFRAMEAVKTLEEKIANIESRNERRFDAIRKATIEKFKASDEFLSAVQEGVTYYINGFKKCQPQFLKVSEGFIFYFCFAAEDEWSNSPAFVDDGHHG